MSLGKFMLIAGLVILAGIVAGAMMTPAQAVSNQATEIVGAPTVSAAFIEQTLEQNQSPAVGTGQDLYNQGVAAHINPALALAFFNHESSYGKYGWARVNLSLGNSRCESWYPCNGGYAHYPRWSVGYHDWYRLINAYIKAGLTTLPAIVHKYAPQQDHNDEAAYVQSVIDDMTAWSQDARKAAGA